MYSSLDKIEVQISSLVPGGNGLARLNDGRAVFVPFTLPGERVLVRIHHEKKDYAQAELLKIIQPSSLRIQPRCRHFGVCGGCDLQHVSYDRQLEIKQNFLRQQFSRLKGVADCLQPVIPSPEEWNYRNSIQLHLDKDGNSGYQKAGSHEIILVQECFLAKDFLWEIRLGFNFEPGCNVDRVILRGSSPEDILMVLESDIVELPEMEVDFPVSVVHSSLNEQVILAGEDFFVINIKDRSFRVSSGSFFQVNTGQAEKMVEIVMDLLQEAKGELLEIFSGVGLFTAFLAPRFKHIVCLEQSSTACANFADNLDEFDHIDLYQGDAAKILPFLNSSPDAILCDPPRAGLTAGEVDWIIRSPASWLVYVSCDPATLVRDLKLLLAGGWREEKIIPLDMFPQTAHIETCTLLRR